MIDTVYKNDFFFFKHFHGEFFFHGCGCMIVFFLCDILSNRVPEHVRSFFFSLGNVREFFSLVQMIIARYFSHESISHPPPRREELNGQPPSKSKQHGHMAIVSICAIDKTKFD